MSVFVQDRSSLGGTKPLAVLGPPSERWEKIFPALHL